MQDPIVIVDRVKLARQASEQDAGGWHSPPLQATEESTSDEDSVDLLGSDFKSKFSPGSYE